MARPHQNRRLRHNKCQVLDLMLTGSCRSRNAPPPKIIVKKEPPTSPELTTSRHRPRKLDLSKGSSANAPLTSRTSGNPLTGMHDVGLACLSPGFSTQDPAMREQLQRSISVRDQQRHIIESRLQKTAKPGEGDSARQAEAPPPPGGSKTPGPRKKAPPGLSIVAPSHEQFANERVIQSAPLHASFPGRHHQPLTRQVTNQPSNLANVSHIHQVPARRTMTTLPPLSDVLPSEGLGVPRESRNVYYGPNSSSNSSHSNHRPNFPSPGHAPPQQMPQSAGRPRDYRSAEEAVASLSGGREDLLPKIIHYGSNHPPTPPSPMAGNGLTPHRLTHSYSSGDISGGGPGRRRQRDEYERDNGSPPLGRGPDTRRGPFGQGRDSPESQRKKKDEFLTLCSRAWDLFHS